MRYLHTMVRVKDVQQSLDFYCGALGMTEVRRMESEKGRFTLIYLASSADVQAGKETDAPLLELTYNWDSEDYAGGRNFGHLAYRVDDIVAVSATLRERGLRLLYDEPRRGTANSRVNFIHPKDAGGVLVELVEPSRDTH